MSGSNKNFSIVRIMERTLDYVDPRLMNHGKRVSYLTYRTLKKRGIRDEGYLHKMAVVALLHDIGAYKTEEIDKMLGFETQKVWEHSIYGYLFLKYFSPVAELAPTILFHHASYPELSYLRPNFREEAQIINIADRFDVSRLYFASPNMREAKSRFESRKGGEFCPELIDLFFAGEEANPLADIERDDEFRELLYGRCLSEREVGDFIKMLVLSIDFRSPQTVLHTFSTAYACAAAAKVLGIGPEERDTLLEGALFHDIGKVAIPTGIIDKAGKLEPEEMAVMRKHVEYTEEILSGEVDDCVLRLAARHHEKLDGSGYPRGLRAGELTRDERLIAVADIFSALTGTRSYKDPFPISKVADILNGMALAGQLDAGIVGVFVAGSERIANEVARETAPIAEAYEHLTAEYAELEQAVSLLGNRTPHEKCCGEGETADFWQKRKHVFHTSLNRPNPSPVHLNFYREQMEPLAAAEAIS